MRLWKARTLVARTALVAVKGLEKRGVAIPIAWDSMARAERWPSLARVPV
ncbi:MAG: hypothetical protein OXC65_02200 [Thiotrichales bacterium]|nr:hypothetical protein [Thiotrichales bacterium]